MTFRGAALSSSAAAIARIVLEPASPADSFDLQELFHVTNAQPMQEGPDAGA
jgi:hypothetical protein